MANPAQEARQKAQAKWPGATVAERGRKYIKHQHPTQAGRFMLDTSIGPIHYGPGDDQEIDTAWQATTGAWDYEMTLNNFQTFARDTFNAGDIFEFQKNGEWVRFDPQSINWIDENTSRQQIAIKQAVAAVVDDDTLRFPEAYGPGRHFEYQNQTARLKKIITIDSASDLPTPTVQGNEVWFEAEFSLSHSAGVEVFLDGVLWEKKNNTRLQTANRVEFRDATTGEVRWWLDFARAWDSSDEIRETFGQLEVRRQGGPSSLFITVRIPKTWIDQATFPIFIDPTVDEQVGASTDDAYQIDGSTATTGSVGSACGTGNTANSPNRSFGCRFPSIGISNGDTIDVAYVELGKNGQSWNTVQCTWFGNDVDDASAFSGGEDMTSRTYTTASVTCDENINRQNNRFFAFPTDGDWSGIVQELVDRGGWSSGNAMAFIADGDGASSYTSTAVHNYDDNATYAPKLHIEYTAAAGGVTVNVPAGSLAITGQVPTITATDDQSVAVPLGTLTITGLVPTATVTDHQSVEVPAGTLTITGFAPGVSTTDHQTVSIPLGTVTITGLAPTVTATEDQLVSVPLGTLTVTGFAPSVSTSADVSIDIPTGSVTITGQAPTVTTTDHQSVAVPAGTVTITGQAPTVSTTDHQVVDVPAGSLTITGYAPIIGGDVSVEVGTGVLMLTGYAPTVTAGEKRPQGSGSIRRRRRRRRIIEEEEFDDSEDIWVILNA